MAGRPRGAWADKAWREALRVVALLDIDDPRRGQTKLEGAAVSLFNAAIAGDVTAIKEIGDRLDGRVPQAHVGGDPDSQPIRVTRIELVDLA